MTGSEPAPVRRHDSPGTAQAVALAQAPELALYSRFVQRLRRRYAPWLALLPAGAPTRETMQTCLEALAESHGCADQIGRAHV